MDKFQLGWNSYFEGYWRVYQNTAYFPGRVVSEQKNIYTVQSEKGEYLAHISGKMMFQIQTKENFPSVGDWVVLELQKQSDQCIIHDILPRKSAFKRKEAGKKREEQVVAANIDYVFIVSALNFDFNLRRLERYLTLSWESNAIPILVLNKADLCTDLEEKKANVEKIAIGTPIYVTSCMNKQGFESLQIYDQPGITVALLGSSGVGKSSIINQLVGKNIQPTQTIRRKDQGGKHTTTSRELFHLPNGGLIIDTPGMRELQLTGSNIGISKSFLDIEILSNECRFANCKHQSEPGCAVLLAIENGILDPIRLKSFQKLQHESSYISKNWKKLNMHKQDAFGY